MHYWNGGIREWFYTYLILATYAHFVYSTAIVNVALIAIGPCKKTIWRTSL